MIASGLKSSAVPVGAVNSVNSSACTAKPALCIVVVSFAKVSGLLSECPRIHCEPDQVFPAETVQDGICSFLRRPRILPAPRPPQELRVTIYHVSHQVVVTTKIALAMGNDES